MPVLIPKEPYASDRLLLRALCMWREARGESFQAKLGVDWTIRNRTALAPREGFRASTRENILKPWAFSSFMEGDPNATKYPEDGDKSWQDCVAIAGATEHADPTAGAVFYHDSSIKRPSAWGNVVPTVQIGRLSFYKLPTT